jgi:enoyl-CoA hydratase/carnithine racemase
MPEGDVPDRDPDHDERAVPPAVDLDFETIRYDVDGSVATVTLARPEMANAQSMRLIDELDAAFRFAGRNEGVRVVILAAEGRHFSSGHDLKELVGPERDEVLDATRSTPEGKFAHEREMYFDRCIAIRDFPKPTIAAVQGKCVAAGLMLAAMCDLIVAADDAEFQNPVARMSGMGVELLTEPWELGGRKAKEFLLTSLVLDAHEAARLGLVNKVVPRDELATAARAMADEVALVPPVTARHIKDSINHTIDLQGQRASWQYHFMAHHFVHNTATALGLLEERQQSKDMREVFEKRDRGG